MKTVCKVCGQDTIIDKGRSPFGKPAYRCTSCGAIWTAGGRGRQRPLPPHWHFEYQFHDTGCPRRRAV